MAFLMLPMVVCAVMLLAGLHVCHRPAITITINPFIFCMVVCSTILLASLLTASVGALSRRNQTLCEQIKNMEHLMQIRQDYYAQVEEKIRETQTLRHDMRHQWVMINGYLKNKQYEVLEAYVDQYRTNNEIYDIENYCNIAVINMLANHYGHIAQKNGILFEMRCDVNSIIEMTDTDLCGLLGNLLENAVEACLRKQSGRRFIRVSVVRSGCMLTIRVWNSATAPAKQRGGGFMSAKKENRAGYGLSSINAIAQKHGGRTVLKWDGENQVFDHMVVLMFQG